MHEKAAFCADIKPLSFLLNLPKIFLKYQRTTKMYFCVCQLNPSEISIYFLEPVLFRKTINNNELMGVGVAQW